MPLKAVTHDAIANVESRAPWDTSNLISIFIYIRFAAPRYVAGTLIIASIYGGYENMKVLILAVCGRSYEISRNCRGPPVLPNAVPQLSVVCSVIRIFARSLVDKQKYW